MQTHQRKAGQVMIKTNRLLPVLLAMASAAVRARWGFVRVILTMTGRACRLELLGLRVALVAGHAAKVRVRAPQGKLRLPGMIELRLTPGFRRVTVIAPGPVSAVVGVVAAMTVDAGLAVRLLEVVSRVTGAAGQARVTLGQREAGLPLVVERLFLPRRGVVAGLAIRPALPLMPVVDPMTGDAGRWRILVTLAGMAQNALDPRMSARQRIGGVARLCVVKMGFLPGSDHVATGTVLA